MKEDPAATRQSRQLKRGWNLVALGREAASEYAAITASCDISVTYGYDTAAGAYFKLTPDLQPTAGGYWVKAREDCTV